MSIRDAFESLNAQVPNKGPWSRRLAIALDPEPDEEVVGSWEERAVRALSTSEGLGSGSWRRKLLRAIELGLVSGDGGEGEVIFEPGEGYDEEDPVTWDPPGSPQASPPAGAPTVHPPTSETLPNGKVRRNVRWDKRTDAEAHDVRLDQDDNLVYDVGYDTEVQIDLNPGQTRKVEVRSRNSQGVGAWSDPMDIVGEEDPPAIATEAGEDLAAEDASILLVEEG